MSTQIIKTTCTMDCPDSCELDVSVSNGRIKKISGAKGQHPNTDGFICTKVQRFDRRIYHEERILYPMRRTGVKGVAEFERISWEAAIDTISGEFRRISKTFGSEAIMPYHYGGSNGLLGDSLLDHYYFAKLGASRCVKTLCAAPTSAVAMEMYGKMPGVAFEDYPEASFILIWGANPKTSNIHLVPYLKEAKAKGAFIAVIDPLKNFSDQEVDLHLPAYPGADLPLALGMINYWVEHRLLDEAFLKAKAVGLSPLLEAASAWPVEQAAAAARLPAADLVRLARTYAEASPALLRCGWGLERNRNGGQAVAAVLAMPALLGKFGIRSGGYTMSNSGAIKYTANAVLGDFKWETRALNQTRLGEFLTTEMDPPIKGLFVYNCNPVATVPDQNRVIRGLKREDLFTVVSEQVMTDSCLYADIVLPAVTFLEQQEIRKSYGSYVIGGVQPAIAPVGEARPNEELFAMLGRAMGWDDPPFTWNTGQYIRRVADALKVDGENGIYSALSAGRAVAYKRGKSTPVQFVSVQPNTPDGKIHLTPSVLGDSPYRYDPVMEKAWPLALISPASSKMISSTLGEFNYRVLFVRMHPDDAARRGIRNGDAVRVYNDLGEVVCRVKVKSSVRPGVLEMPKGAWRKSSLNGMTSTALCPATTNIVAGGACFNDARVEIEKTN